MNTYFQERGRRTPCPINDGLARIVPSAMDFQPACSGEFAMPADPPEDHLDEHALINLNEQFFENPAACVRVKR